jgi:hypothetical protein
MTGAVWAPDLLAGIIAVPDDPLSKIEVTESVRFVGKGRQIYRHEGDVG